MAILRKSNKERYTTILQSITTDSRLSLKDLGLLVKLLSLPDNWNFSERGLAKILEQDGQTSIRTAIKNLENYGYLKRVRTHDEKGKVTGVEWIVNEDPETKKECENPRLENPNMDFPNLETQPQYNTKELNTNELSTNSKKERKKKEQPKQIHTDNKENKKNNTCRKTYDQIIEEYTDNEDLRNELKENLKTRKMKKALPTNHGLLSDLKDLDSISLSTLEKIEIVKKSNERGWASFYPLNEYDSNHRLSFDKLKEYDC